MEITQEMTAPELARPAATQETKIMQYGHAKRKRAPSESRIGQSTCRVCGKIAHPGSAIVRQFGAGGRVHEHCTR